MYPCIHFKHPVCCLFIFVGMGKIEGNIMIDVSPSNNKLLDRATRILQYLLVLHASNPDFHSRYSEGDLSALFPYCILYEAVERAFAFKKLLESQHSLLAAAPVSQVWQLVLLACSI